MENYVHARLGREEVKLLKELKTITKETASSLIKKGLRLVYEKNAKKPGNAFEAAKDLAGKYSSEYGDLSANKKHMEGYGR